MSLKRREKRKSAWFVFIFKHTTFFFFNLSLPCMFPLWITKETRMNFYLINKNKNLNPFNYHHCELGKMNAGCNCPNTMTSFQWKIKTKLTGKLNFPFGWQKGKAKWPMSFFSSFFFLREGCGVTGRFFLFFV